MKPPLSLTLYRDSREHFVMPYNPVRLWYPGPAHTPLRFLIKAEKFAMTASSGYAGDYALKDFPLAGGLERKASIRELYNNLLGAMKERARFLRALDRFARLSHPYLWLDMDWTDMFAFEDLDPLRIHDLLLRVCQQRRIAIIGPTCAKTPKTRLKMGNFLVGLLISAAFGPSDVPETSPQKIFGNIGFSLDTGNVSRLDSQDEVAAVSNSN